MKSLEVLPTIPRAFAPSSLRRLLDDDVLAAASCGEGRILLATGKADLVLVDDKGKELHRLAAPKPDHKFAGSPPIYDLTVNGNRFAVGVFTHVVIGEIEGRQLRILSTSTPFSDLVQRVAIGRDGIRATTGGGKNFAVSFDGTVKGGASKKRTGAKSTSDEPSVKELRASRSKLAKLQTKYSAVGAADNENEEAIVVACKEAMDATSRKLPTVAWSLYEDASAQASAIKALDTAAIALLTLVKKAAKTNPSALQQLFDDDGEVESRPFAFVPSAGVSKRTHERGGGEELSVLEAGDGKLVIWPFPAVARYGAAKPGERSAWIVDEADFGEAAYDTGKKLFFSPNGRSLFVLHKGFIERVDTKTKKREIVYSGESEKGISSPGGRIATTKLTGVAHSSSIVDLETQNVRKLPQAQLVAGGILQAKGGECRAFDFDGNLLLKMSVAQPGHASVDQKTKTVGIISYEPPTSLRTKCHIFRADALEPLVSTRGITKVYVEGDLAFMVSERQERNVRVLDIESGSTHEVSKAVFASDYDDDVKPIHDGVAYAFAASETGEATPRCVAISRNDSKVGPLLTKSKKARSTSLEAIGDGFLVVTVNVDNAVQVIVVDMVTLAPIGEPIGSPMDCISAAATRDELALLYKDGTIARYRVTA